VSERGPRAPRPRAITKAILAERLSASTGLPRVEAADLVETLLEVMKETLEAGENIKLSGFGSFVVRAKAARRGRNPTTSAAITLPRRRVLKFRPSLGLRQALRERA
jgi:integration host factor subunit alpha